MKRKLFVFAVAAGVAACSSLTPQKAPEPDTSPTHSTAVFETHITSGGVMGYSPYEGTGMRYVRTDMRRKDSNLKSTGTFSVVSNLFTADDKTDIERLDRNVRWTLNNSKKEYSECPVHGCPVLGVKEQKAEEKKSSEPKAKTDSGCSMKIANTRFSVKPTGEKRVINGFSSDKYQIAWLVTLQDASSRKTASTVNIELWTTPITAEMRKALSVEEAFNKAYLAGAPRAQRAAAKKSTEVLPPEVSRMILGYLSSTLSSADRDAFVKAGREMEKIKGHPISTHIEWSMEGNACAAKDSPSESTGPILSFTTEVKTLKTDQVHDSLFSVPKDYKLASER
ncbi:MAG TPA: hypothetical protein VEG25_02905 [Burkholderiales bacterium]|nr:hypothetical protein [Burkholderiales bacterium]